MTPKEVEDNLRLFNEASAASQEALGNIHRLMPTSQTSTEFRSALNAFLGAVDIMISTSAELIGQTGPLAEKGDV